MSSDSEPGFFFTSPDEQEGDTVIVGLLSADELERDRQIFRWFLNPKTMKRALKFVGISEINSVYRYPIDRLRTYPGNSFEARGLYFFQPEYTNADENSCPGQHWTTSLIMIIRDGEQVLGSKKIMVYSVEHSPDSKWLMEEYRVNPDNFPRALEPHEKFTLNRIYVLHKETRDQAGKDEDLVMGASAEDHDDEDETNSQGQAATDNSREHGKSSQDQAGDNENSDRGAKSEHQLSSLSQKAGSTLSKSNETGSGSGTKSGSSEARGSDRGNKSPDSSTDNQSKKAKTT